MILVENLTKTFKLFKRKEGFVGSITSIFNREYEWKKVVNNVSFTINKGEIVGFLGPNGAGKSTTIKMLTGILVPTNGTIKVDGLVPTLDRKKNAKNIGVVFGQRTQLWWDIPVKESLKLMKVMYNIPDKEYKKALELFNEILGLNEFDNTPVRQLSLGQRMRADLCCAFLHSPEIVFLDEPTIGLDVIAKKKIREFIKEINQKRETTIILTTHDVSDIDFLCNRVMVIDKGEIIYNGELESLKKKIFKLRKNYF